MNNLSNLTLASLIALALTACSTSLPPVSTVTVTQPSLQPSIQPETPATPVTNQATVTIPATDNATPVGNHATSVAPSKDNSEATTVNTVNNPFDRKQLNALSQEFWQETVKQVQPEYTPEQLQEELNSIDKARQHLNDTYYTPAVPSNLEELLKDK